MSSVASHVRTPLIPQMEDQDCGAACLASIVNALGRRVTLREVARVCGPSRDGVSAAALSRAAGHYGLVARGMRVRPDAGRWRGLDRIPAASIVQVTGPHFIVFEGLRHGKARLNDPTSGRYAVSPDSFWRDFTGVALAFTPGPGFRLRGARLPFLRAMHARLRGYRGALALAIVLGVLAAVPGVLVAQLVRAAIRYTGSPHGEIAAFAVAGVVAALAMALGIWVQQSIFARVLQTMSARTSARFLWRMLRLPGTFFHRRSLGGLVTRVQVNDGIAVLLSGRLVTVAASMFTAVLYLAALVWLDPQLSLVAAGAGLLQVLALAGIARARATSLHLLQGAEAKRDAAAFAGVAAIESLKAEGTEAAFFTGWAGHQARVLRLNQRIAASTLALFCASSMVGTVASGVAIVLGFGRVLSGRTDFGSLLAFLLLMNAFLMPLGSVVGIGSELLVARAQSALLEDVEEAEPDPFLRPILDSDDGPALTGALRLDEVTVGYDRNAPALLHGVSLDVRPGEWVAVVGPTGSGKSTLARLAAGVLRPWAGTVRLDGQARDALPRARVTAAVAYVDQKINLFEGTVRDNLTLWNHAAAGDEDLWDALHDADVDQVVRRRGGLDAVVAENARNFSGGEKQRLEIARALVGNPVLLILDEATSALDADTEHTVNRRLRARGCSCLILAHRATTVREADRVVVLDAGRVVENSAPDELAAAAAGHAALLGDAS